MVPRAPGLIKLKTLVVDDETVLTRVVARNLGRAGAEVTVAHRVGDGLSALETTNSWDIVLVDQMFPDGDGLDIVERIARLDPRPGVVALFANQQSPKRSLRLQAHRAVLLPKPFSMEELFQAVSHALSTRTAPTYSAATLDDSLPKHLRYRNISLDLVTQIATVDGATIDLQPAQVRILAQLLAHPGRSFNALELTQAALRGSHGQYASNIRFQIHTLRRRLGSAADLIVTGNRGYGIGIAC